MTFATPSFLIALVALPVLLGLYAVRLRPVGAGRAAFAAPHLLPSVLPRRPRWRRHLPILVLLLAAAALIVGAARPQRSVAVELPQASIMLMTDVSGSMQAADVAPNRLTAAQRAARAFLASVPKRVKVGIMAFNQTPTLLQSPTTDRQTTAQAIGQLKISGGTATGEAVLAALRALPQTSAASTSKPQNAIVLLSDGKSTRGANPVTAAAKAKAAKVPIYTVALGTQSGTITVRSASGTTRTVAVPPDPQTLAAMARASGGKSFSVADASKLAAVYQDLGATLSHVTRKEQLTVWFAGAGLLMLLASGAMSLRWFGRLA